MLEEAVDMVELDSSSLQRESEREMASDSLSAR
jgi:hypothetical protein